MQFPGIDVYAVVRRKDLRQGIGKPFCQITVDGTAHHQNVDLDLMVIIYVYQTVTQSIQHAP